MEATEARADARTQRALDKARAYAAWFRDHPDQWGYTPAAYARTFRRATITPVIMAKAPTRPIRFHIPVDPPRRRSRYWLVGLYVIEEDRFGDTWIMSRGQLEAFDPDDGGRCCPISTCPSCSPIPPA